MLSWELVGRMVGALVALVLVLFAAWLLLRWMNNRMPGMGGGGASRLVKVLDRVPVGKSGSILLLRVQDKVLLVAVTEHNAEKLCEFDDPDGTIAPSTPAGEVPGFAAVLKDTARKMMGKEPAKPAGGQDAFDEPDVPDERDDLERPDAPDELDVPDERDAPESQKDGGEAP